MTADLSFEQLIALIERGEPQPIADALLTTSEPGRRELGRRLPNLTTARMPNAHVSTLEWQRVQERRDTAKAVAGAGCLTGAPKIVTWLRNHGSFHDPRVITAIIRVLSAPGRPALGTVARGLATRLRSDDVDAQWPLVSRLLDAAGEPVPPTEATLRGWLRATGCSASSLRSDLRTNQLLPHVFRVPRLGGDVSAGGLANLTEQRVVILDGCAHRLAEGDRPGMIRPFVELHRLLAPTLDERAANQQAYLTMVSSPHSTVVAIALESLRTVDDAGLLDTAAVADAALSVLSRREKTLVRAQLAWLDSALTRKPSPELFEALLTGLGNESVDLAERTLRVVAKHLPAFDPAVLARLAPDLTGDLRRQVDALLPAPALASDGPVGAGSVGDGPPAAMAGVPAAASMPAPLRSAVEVAAVLGELFRQGERDPVLLEQALDGLARFAHDDQAALVAALTSVPVPNWDDPLCALVRTVTGGTWSPWTPGYWDFQLAPPPFWMLPERLGELARQMIGTPPPALLATPATVDGHVSPARVLELLVAAERDGWQPGPFDLAQAVLRLPRTVDPAIIAGAGRLTSPAGRFLADWLNGGGLSDPLVTTTEVLWHHCADVRACRCGTTWRATFDALPRHVPIAPCPPRAWESTPFTGLAVPAGLLDMAPLSGRPPYSPSLHDWPMVLPGHPEIIAAHALPNIFDAAYREHRHRLQVLPALAASTGPFGPAMALCLAAGLTADQPAGRVNATDAFIELAARGKLNGTLVGRELTRLHDNGNLPLKRLTGCLTEAMRAGRAAEVWATARELLPAALAAPGPGTPDLLAVAESAAAAVHATDDVPGLASAAARPGRNRLAVEVARLNRTLTVNRAT